VPPTLVEEGGGRRIRRAVAIAILVLLGAFGLAQLIPNGVSNPSTRVEPRWDSPQTRGLAVAACFDCHSNQSRHFWYESIQPIKWWTGKHVSEVRAKLNFDEWNRPQRAAGRAVRSVTDGRMPPPYY